MQRALKAAGYYSGSIDGAFGSTTQVALEDWQAAQGLTQTGSIDISKFVWVPKGAVISAWQVNLGSYVSSGAALASVSFNRPLQAQALVDQTQVNSLKTGQSAQLALDGLSTASFTATIASISQAPASSGSSSTVEYTVTLNVKDPPALARQGMTGTLTIVLASRSNVLLVPTSAVLGSGSSPLVRVLQNGAPVYRSVTTGMATSSLTQITSGLAAGETVVTGVITSAASTTHDHHRRRLRWPRRLAAASAAAAAVLPPLERWWHLIGRRHHRRRLFRQQQRAVLQSMIVFLESVRLAFSGLRGNPLRSALTILGILIGIAAVVALTAIGLGSQRSVEARFNAFGTDTITVTPSGFSSITAPLTMSDLAAINKTPGVKKTVYSVNTNATVTLGSASAQATVSGSGPGIYAIDNLSLTAGTFFSGFAAARRSSRRGARLQRDQRLRRLAGRRHRPHHKRRRVSLPGHRRAGTAGRRQLLLGRQRRHGAPRLDAGHPGGLPSADLADPRAGGAQRPRHLSVGRREHAACPARPELLPNRTTSRSSTPVRSPRRSLPPRRRSPT